jgi:predicted CXXCH cytochrome family protein
MRTKFVLLAILSLLTVPTALAHVDSHQLTDPCGSCHVGHGMDDEPMLAKSEERFCFQCHGSDEERANMQAAGRLVPGARLQDMRPEFNKLYSHPVERGAGHNPDEKLPAYTGAKTSHAECVDCHNPHQRVNQGKAMDFAVRGYTLTGQIQERALYEYNICLKCHTDISGADSGGRSIVRDFARSGRSQHPVTNGSSGRRQPSLADQMPGGTRMKCSDCHRSDDPSSPAGPHGSRNEFMLSGNYSREIYLDESPYAYEFCYRCHDRFSIMANESFPLHRQHIEGDPLTGRKGTSCFTCHTAHGSPLNPYLIEFNLQAVQPADGTGRISFESFSEGTGNCTLKCHKYNHSPGSY